MLFEAVTTVLLLFLDLAGGKAVRDAEITGVVNLDNYDMLTWPFWFQL